MGSAEADANKQLVLSGPKAEKQATRAVGSADAAAGEPLGL